MKRATIWNMLALNAYHFGLGFMWQSLHPIVLPAVLLNFVPEAQKNTYLGLMTFAGLIIAIIIQPLSGAWSDRCQSRWGRRRPLIVLGTLVDMLFLAFLAWSGGLLWIVIGYIGLQFSSNVAHGPAQGLLPDRVPREQHGAASGIKNLLDMGGLVVASLLAGRLLDPEARHPVWIVLVIMGVMAAVAAITALGTPEAPTRRDDDTPAAETPNPLADLLRTDFRAHKPFWWLLAVRLTYLLGVYGVQSFLQYYLRDVLEVPNPAQQTGDLLAAIALALIAFSVLSGWLTDRLGAKPMMVVAGVLGIIGFAILPFAHTPTQLLLMGSVLGAGIGVFLSANWALATRLVPSEEAGKFMGLTNLATGGAGALGRLQGPAIDLLNSANPGAWMGYTGMFVFGGICVAISMLLLLKVAEPKREGGSEEVMTV
jgi:MFS family permease